MTCQEFLNGYSEYLDGELDDLSSGRWRQHMDACDSCRRYDDVVRRGLSLVRELPEIEPSPDFESKLHRRIWGMEMDDDAAAGPSTSVGTIAGLAIAATLALIAWSPLVWREVAPTSPGLAGDARLEAEVGAAPEMATSEPQPLPARTNAPAFTSVVDAFTVPAGGTEVATQWQLYSDGTGAVSEDVVDAGDVAIVGPDSTDTDLDPDPADAISEPGPYSPLIVGPPVFQSQRRPGDRVTAVSASPFD